MWQESQYLPTSGIDSGVHSGATTRGTGSLSGYEFNNPSKMEMPVTANTSGDLYDMNRAGYDQGYTQQEVEGEFNVHQVCTVLNFYVYSKNTVQ
jgi:hypothetical protein